MNIEKVCKKSCRESRKNDNAQKSREKMMSGEEEECSLKTREKNDVGRGMNMKIKKVCKDARERRKIEEFKI